MDTNFEEIFQKIYKWQKKNLKIIFRELKINTRSHNVPTRMVKIKKNNRTKCWWVCTEIGLFMYVGGKIKKSHGRGAVRFL